MPGLLEPAEAKTEAQERVDRLTLLLELQKRTKETALQIRESRKQQLAQLQAKVDLIGRAPEPTTQAVNYQQYAEAGLAPEGVGGSGQMPIVPPAPEPEPTTLLEKVDNAKNAFVRALGRTATGIPKAAVIAFDAAVDAVNKAVDAVPNEADAKDYAVFKFAQEMDKLANEWFPQDPRLKDSFLAEVLPGAAGSMAGFVGMGALTGGVGGAVGLGARATGLIASGGVGAALESSGLYEEAIASGATEDQAKLAAAWGIPLGATEALPLGRILKRFDKATGGKFSKGLLKKSIVDGLIGGTEEGVQEFIQQIGGNEVARRLFDENRKTFDSAFEGGAAGTILGFAMSALATAAGAKIRRRPPPGQAVEGPPPPREGPPLEQERPPQGTAPDTVGPYKPTKESFTTKEGVRQFLDENPERHELLRSLIGKDKVSVKEFEAATGMSRKWLGVGGIRISAADRLTFAKELENAAKGQEVQQPEKVPPEAVEVAQPEPKVEAAEEPRVLAEKEAPDEPHPVPVAPAAEPSVEVPVSPAVEVPKTTEKGAKLRKPLLSTSDRAKIEARAELPPTHAAQFVTAEKADMPESVYRNTAKGVRLLKKFVATVPEFSLDPTFVVTKDKRLRFQDGAKFTFYPKAIAIVLPEGAKEGDRIRIDVEAVKAAKVLKIADRQVLMAEAAKALAAPEVGGVSGGGAAFARQEGSEVRTDFPIKEGGAVGAVARRMSVKAMPMPELVALAKDLMGKAPTIKPLRKSLGLFKSREGEAPISIIIDPKTAKSEVELGQVLAHEIGHLTDFLPTQTLARGNILGRIRTLRKFLRGSFGEGSVTNKEIRAELIALSEWWTPYEKGTQKTSYRKYRESSRELYAQALSVMLNTPGELQERAPKFYAEVMEHFDKKPQFLESFLSLQDILSGTPEKLAERRGRSIREGFASGQEKMQAAVTAREASRKSTGEALRQFLETYVLDRLSPAKDVHRRVDDTKNAEYMLDELFEVDNDGHVLINRADAQILRPLYDAGLTKDDMGEYLFLRRVVNERNEIANPLGFTPSTAKEQIKAMKDRLGDAKWETLDTTMQKWHQELIFPVSEKALKAGIISEELFKETIEPNKDNYATFAVVKYLEDYISSAIHEQVGTFEEVANPYDSTMMKMLTTLRHAQLNAAKRQLRDSMKRGHLDIEPAKIRHGDREPRKPAPHGKEYLLLLEDGKPEAWIVDKAIAKSFNSHDIGGLINLARLQSRLVYKTFHPLYVTFSPGFLVANPSRDLRRTHVNLSAVVAGDRRRRARQLVAEGKPRREAKKLAKKQHPDVSVAEVLREFIKGIPQGKLRAKGINSELLNTMLEEKALATRYTEWTSEAEGFGLPIPLPGQPTEKGLVTNWKESQTIVRKFIGSSLDLMRMAGEVQETASNIAARQILKARGNDVVTRSYRVRKYAATPDYKQAGHATPITNSTWMYSRVKFNGWQHSASLAFGKDTASTWWWKQFVWTIMPTTISKLAMYGLFGPALAALFANIGKYFLDNYDVIPLGMVDDDGEEKTLFLTVPMSDEQKLIKKLWGTFMDLALAKAGHKKETSADTIGKAAKEVFGDLADSLMPTLNPALDIAWKWGQFAGGRNPYDSHYGTQVVPRSEWEAGGWDATKKMIMWTVNKSGSLKAVIHPVVEKVIGGGQAFESGKETTLEVGLRAIPGASRLIRLSDRGIDDEHWAGIENESREKAKHRLKLPKSVRRLTTERYKLMSRRRKLTNDELVRKFSLDAWYGDHYGPMTKKIRDATDLGNAEEADTLRKQLGESAASAGINPEQDARRMIGKSLYSNVSGPSASEARNIKATLGELREWRRRGLELAYLISVQREHYKSTRKPPNRNVAARAKWTRGKKPKLVPNKTFIQRESRLTRLWHQSAN